METLLIGGRFTRVPFVYDPVYEDGLYKAVINGHNCEYHRGIWICVDDDE